MVIKHLHSSNDKSKTERTQLTHQLNDVNHRLTMQYEAIESGVIELGLLADRIRQLKDEKEQIELHIEKLNQTKPPPPHLLQDGSIEGFKALIRDAFRNGSNRKLVKRYLRLFIDRIVIKLPVLEIEGNTKAVLETIQNEKAAKTGVLTAGITWLPG